MPQTNNIVRDYIREDELNEIRSEILELDLAIEKAKADNVSSFYLACITNHQVGLKWALSVIEDGYRKHTLVKAKRGRAS